MHDTYPEDARIIDLGNAAFTEVAGAVGAYVYNVHTAAHGITDRPWSTLTAYERNVWIEVARMGYLCGFSDGEMLGREAPDA